MDKKKASEAMTKALKTKGMEPNRRSRHKKSILKFEMKGGVPKQSGWLDEDK